MSNRGKEAPFTSSAVLICSASPPSFETFVASLVSGAGSAPAPPLIRRWLVSVVHLWTPRTAARRASTLSHSSSTVLSYSVGRAACSSLISETSGAESAPAPHFVGGRLVSSSWRASTTGSPLRAGRVVAASFTTTAGSLNPAGFSVTAGSASASGTNSASLQPIVVGELASCPRSASEVMFWWQKPDPGFPLCALSFASLVCSVREGGLWG